MTYLLFLAGSNMLKLEQREKKKKEQREQQFSICLYGISNVPLGIILIVKIWTLSATHFART